MRPAACVLAYITRHFLIRRIYWCVTLKPDFEWSNLVLLFFADHFSVASIMATLLVLLFSMSLHEFGHAAMATWWGDDTPRRMGRLTLNPLVHINWIGFLMFVVVGFGILGQVPVNPARMRNPRWGSFWTSFAGPLMNLVTAIVCAIGLRLLFPVPSTALNLYFYGDVVPVGNYLGVVPDTIGVFLIAGVFWNLLLFFFNLLPFFPIDGWRMVLALLPGYWLRRDQVPAAIRRNLPPLSQFLQEPAYKWQQWAMLSQMVLFGLIILSFVVPRFNVLGALISQPTYETMFRLIGL